MLNRLRLWLDKRTVMRLYKNAHWQKQEKSWSYHELYLRCFDEDRDRLNAALDALEADGVLKASADGKMVLWING